MPITTAEQLLALLDSFPWPEWQKRLEPAVSQCYRDVMMVQGERGAEAAGGEWDPNDPFLSKFATRYVGERVVQLEGTTRDAVADLLVRIWDENEAAGGSQLELAEKIRDKVRETFDGYETWRAQRIARTESAIAYNHGDIFGFKQAGVELVDIIDGTNDTACAEANRHRGEDGWTLAEALADPIAHPNCTRVFVAQVPDAAEGESVPGIPDDWAVICAQFAELVAQGEDPTPWLREPEDEEASVGS